jgi:hypothetical protein
MGEVKEVESNVDLARIFLSGTTALLIVGEGEKRSREAGTHA